MVMYCYNQAAIYNANNHVFHEKTNHIETDCHSIQDIVMTKQIVTFYVASEAQNSDIFTKTLSHKSYSILCNNLGMNDIYAPARREVLVSY